MSAHRIIWKMLQLNFMSKDSNLIGPALLGMRTSVSRTMAGRINSFVGDKWHRIKKLERKQYLKNTYRVLLTRARQGMVIVVPNGSEEDQTRKADYYNTTFRYLSELGLEEL